MLFCIWKMSYFFYCFILTIHSFRHLKIFNICCCYFCKFEFWFVKIIEKDISCFIANCEVFSTHKSLILSNALLTLNICVIDVAMVESNTLYTPNEIVRWLLIAETVLQWNMYVLSYTLNELYEKPFFDPSNMYFEKRNELFSSFVRFGYAYGRHRRSRVSKMQPFSISKYSRLYWSYTTTF